MNIDLDRVVDGIEANDWALTYLIPGFYSGGFIPEESVYPTSSQVLNFDRVFQASPDGKFLAMFSPVIEAFISHAPVLGTFEGLQTGIPESYRVYCDNDGKTLPVTGNLLNNAASWPYNKQPSSDLLQYYKKLRVIGAAISIEVNDIVGDYRGVIECCEYFQIAGSVLSGDEIDITKLNKYPRYSVNSVTRKIDMRYRKNSSKLDHFGPYEPFTTIPFFLFSGSGLSPNANIHVSYKIHIEGILLPALVHFSTNTSRQFVDKMSQLQIIEEFERGDIDVDETMEMMSMYSQATVKKHMSYEEGANMDLTDSGEWMIQPWGIVKPTLKTQKTPKIKIESGNTPLTAKQERAFLIKYAKSREIINNIRNLSKENRALIYRYSAYIHDSKITNDRKDAIEKLIMSDDRFLRLSGDDQTMVEKHVLYGSKLFEGDDDTYERDYSEVDRLTELDRFFESKYKNMTKKEERELIERTKKQAEDNYNEKLESMASFFELATNAARSLYSMSNSMKSFTELASNVAGPGLRMA